MQVQSLVGKLRSPRLHGEAKKIERLQSHESDDLNSNYAPIASIPLTALLKCKYISIHDMTCYVMLCCNMGFPGGSAIKNLPKNVGDTRDSGSIPGSERSQEKEMATHSSTLVWRSPWTEKPGGL